MNIIDYLFIDGSKIPIDHGYPLFRSVWVSRNCTETSESVFIRSEVADRGGRPELDRFVTASAPAPSGGGVLHALRFGAGLDGHSCEWHPEVEALNYRQASERGW